MGEFLRRGILFSTDAMFAFLIICGMLYLMVLQLDFRGSNGLEGLRGFSLNKNALLLADSLVKNCETGFAKYNSSIRRCEIGVLDFKGKIDFKELKNDEFFVKRVEVVKKNGWNKVLLQKNKEGGNCLSVERIVYFEDVKAKLILVVCDA